MTPRLRTQFDPEISYELERLAARAWPADEVHDVGGWLLRRTEGVDRRRSNSLLPPADPAAARRTLDLALATAEELDIPPVIQVSPAESHLGLDDALASMGATATGRSLVLAGPLAGQAGGGRGGRAGDDHRRRPAEVRVALSPLTPAWVEAWAAVSGIDGTVATAELVLSQLGERARFVMASQPSTLEPLAVGIGVAEDGWLGLFSLATAPGARRRGIASAVIAELEGWAGTRGARGTYLQVEADNSSALTLYANRGFHVAHSYHYRSL